MNGGSNFGTSMSFPQTGSSTNSGFNFQPPQSSSFTFGAPTGTPNPFATLNGTGGPGNSQQSDIAMESPQKKTATGSTFGSNSGFSFGQPTQQPSSSAFSFGGTQSTQPAANGTNPFNAVSKPDDSGVPANPFGQTSQPAFSGFGQSAQAQSPGFTFGQSTSTPAPAATTTAPSFSFGLNTSASAPATTAPSFSFGQTTAAPQSALPSFSFGQANTTQPEAPKEAPKFSFGQTPATAESQPTGPSFGFASPAATPASKPASTFSFGQMQQPPASSPSFTGFDVKSGETTPASSLFGPPTTTPQPATTEQRSQSPDKPDTPEPEKNATNPFASLFAGSSSASPAPVSKPAFSFGAASTSETNNVTEPTSTPSKPAFSFGAIDQASTSAAGAVAPKPSNNGSTFSFGAKSAQIEDSPTTRGPQANVGTIAGEEKSKGQEESTTSAKPIFGFAQSASPAPAGGLFSPEKSDDKPKAMSNSTAPAKDSAVSVAFGGMSAPGSSFKVGTAFEGPKSIQKPLFGASPQPTPRTEGKPRPAPTFSAPTADKAAEDASGRSIFSTESTTIQAQGSVGRAADAASVAEPSKHPVYTKGSSYFPGHLDAKKFQEYDRDYRLHSLNRELQKRIAALDPTVHDFGNIIRHYVAARDGIGASLGLYKRNFAGTKRKGDDVDDHDDEPPATKRTRPGENEQAQPPQHASAPKSSAGPFTPQPSSFKAASTTLFPSTGAESSSKAAALLNNMIPQSAPAKSSQSVAAFNSSTSPAAGREMTSGAAANPFTSLQSQNTGPTSGPSTSTSTTPTRSPPKKPTFELPKFGGGSTNFMSSFGQQAKVNAEKFEKSLMEKRKAEDFDSDEDDEEQFQKQLDEEAKAKRAKIDAIAKGGFTPSFNPIAKSASPNRAKEGETPKSTYGGFKPFASNPFAALNSTETSEEHSQAEDEDEEASASPASDDEEGDGENQDEEGLEAQNEEDEDEEEDDDDNDFQTAMAKSRNSANAGKSLFDRIEPNPNKQESTMNDEEKTNASTEEAPPAQAANKSTFSSSGFGFQAGKSPPEKSSFSPNTPATGTYKPSTTFSFTPTPPTSSSTPTPGASIFAGGMTKDGPVPGEGLFGSRPSTPSNGEKSNNLARSVLTSPAGTDNTWKQGAAISFANGENKAEAPSFKFTAPSPGKEMPKPFGSLFGTPAPGAKTSDTPTVGFQFGAPSSTPAPGFLGAVTHLGGGSATSSAMSSRATSPGLTDNESNATNDTEETNDEPQVTLMDSRAGEENETCLWEGRSKALMFVNKDIAQGTKLTPNDWNSMGVGIMRVLKDKTTGKTRVVFRVEPSASVLINSHLLDSVTYENVASNKSGAVRGALFYKGNLARWVFKVKTPDMAGQLSTILEENKKSD